MSKFNTCNIQCPFYLKEGQSFITCEGILANTKTTHRFVSEFEKDEYKDSTCSVNGGRRCPHFRNLSILYERGLKA